MNIYTIAQHNMKLEIPYNNKLLKMRKKEKDFKRTLKGSSISLIQVCRIIYIMLN